MKTQSQIQQFLSDKREKRRLKILAEERSRRLYRAMRLNDRPLSLTQTLRVLQNHVPSSIRIKRSRSLKRKLAKITIPDTFSIVDNTEHSLNVIYQLVALSRRRPPPREIDFDHSSLTTFDLAAEVILDIVALEFRRIRQRAKGGLQFRGTLPSDSLANRFIRSMGIIRHLNQTPYFLRKEERKDLRLLRFHSYKTLLRPSEESPTERATRSLVDYFNACLLTSGVELTRHGRHRLAMYAGEVLDNAAEHGNTQDWVLVGYLDLSTPSRACEIAIVNFGKSFAETFSQLPEQHYTRQYVDPFVKLHEKRGFFRLEWAPDNLLSVVALQGQVSSKNNGPEDTRGNGTIDLIQFFQDVCSENTSDKMETAKMVIVSGRTRILFDGTHKMAKASGKSHIIAFNSKNDLNLPPDRSHVQCLNGVEFPGTVVSIKFPLPKAATRTVRTK